MQSSTLMVGVVVDRYASERVQIVGSSSLATTGASCSSSLPSAGMRCTGPARMVDRQRNLAWLSSTT